MLVYPQLSSGALSQFPAVRKRGARTILNTAGDGSTVKLIDIGGGTTEWQLCYSGLSDQELAALQQFFEAAEGSLNGFTFLDPCANLLGWSEDLTNCVWKADPSLLLESGLADAFGGTNAWQVTNRGAGPQSLSQTLNAPSGYHYCFSVYMKASQSVTTILTTGDSQANYPLNTSWSRVLARGTGDINGTSITFGIVLPVGAVVEIFAPQAEAQGAPSAYQTSTTGGIYPGARLRDDALAFTTTGVNCHSATVNIFYANHF